MRVDPQLVKDSRDWVSNARTEEAFGALEATVVELERQEQPTVTLIGAYDTGKSALLRRILVDAGSSVPEWLTISGRHETFEANSVSVLGCTVRDTPGFITESGSNRSQIHNVASRSAADLTDVLILVFTPQLATAERDMLLEILAQPWPVGSLACVINRFDEAGVSPEEDADGYEELAQRKVAELRASLPLPKESPVFVVAADPFGLNGSDREPDRASWDEFRSWDGVDGLRRWLEAVPADLQAVRSAAVDRHWRRALLESAADMADAKVDLAELLREADAASDRLRLDRQRLQAIDGAARARLEQAIEETILSADRKSTLDESWLAGTLQTKLDLWFERAISELSELDEELIADYEQQAKRPFMAKFGLGVDADKSSNGGDGSLPDRKTVERIGNAGLKAWKTYRTDMRAVAASARPKRAARGASQVASPQVTTEQKAFTAVEAVLPLAYELYDLLRSRATSEAEAKAAEKRRAQLRAVIRDEAVKAADPFREEWDGLVQAHANQTHAAWGGIAEQAPKIRQELESLADLLAEAKELTRRWGAAEHVQGAK